MAVVGTLAAGRYGLGVAGALLAPSAGGFFHLCVYFALARPPHAAIPALPLAAPVLLLMAETAISAVRVFSRRGQAMPRGVGLPVLAGVLAWAGALVALVAARPVLTLAAGWAAAGGTLALGAVFMVLNRAHVAAALREA